MGWEVLYAPGSTPSLDAVCGAIVGKDGGGSRNPAFACERLSNPASGVPTLECMVGGLAFDVAPNDTWDAADNPQIEYTFDVDLDSLPVRHGLSIVPGPNIASAAHALPVVRAGAALVRSICEIGEPLTVIWRPIGSAMAARYFEDVADSWLHGGPFPALGLTALRAAPDGGLHSHGLALFTGQELRLTPPIAETGSNAYALGARLIDRLVEGDPVRRPFALSAQDGRTINLAPSPNHRFVIAEWG